MFKNTNFIKKEIYTAALIKPRQTEDKVIRYASKVPRYELIYKLSGEVITHFNGKVFHIKPGAVYILPKCDNADYYIERIDPGDCIDIFFDTDMPLFQNLYLINFSENAKISNLFNKIYKLWTTKPIGYYSKCMSMVYEILYEMILKDNKYLPNSKYQQIGPGIEYIHNNLYNEINYYLPSELCGISYTYFKKLFIEKFGIPPVQYVNNLRLERGKELLLTNQYSVGEIAKMCGFENTYYFSKKFKEKYHCAPTLYKSFP